MTANESPASAAGLPVWLPPELTAHKTLSGGQAACLGAASLAIVVAALAAPVAVGIALIALATALYASAVAYRLAAFWSALRRPEVVRISDADARAMPVDRLPAYTILVPAYHEPSVIAALVTQLSRLEYPAEKLDIRLLLEEDDPETISAAAAAIDGPQFQIVRIPASEPRTKPKACNVGLAGARGELVTIYDAEDKPEPLQLRRAAAAFSRIDPSIACLQAKLAYFNADQNMLTRWFAIEYSMWFSMLLPGLVRRDAPLPLGGTSNHFRRDILERLGAWDPYNVTEDADLGIRLHRQGFRTRVLESTTLEEANSDVINWVKQRSRWYKGYLQTWLVHMRQPRELVRQVGWRGLAGLTLFVAGTPLLSALNSIVWALTALWFLAHPAVIQHLFPAWLYYPSLAVMAAGNAALYYTWIVAARMSGVPRLAYAAAIVPVYWLLMSLAALKAMAQLVSAPSFWEKTVHGLDALAEAERTQEAPGGAAGA